jgi:hypothetical protein
MKRIESIFQTLHFVEFDYFWSTWFCLLEFVMTVSTSTTRSWRDMLAEVHLIFGISSRPVPQNIAVLTKSILQRTLADRLICLAYYFAVTISLTGMSKCAGPSTCSKLIPSVACCFVTTAILSAGALMSFRPANRSSTRKAITMAQAQVAGGRGLIIPAPSGTADSTVIFLHGLGKSQLPLSPQTISIGPLPLLRSRE